MITSSANLARTVVVVLCGVILWLATGLGGFYLGQRSIPSPIVIDNNDATCPMIVDDGPIWQAPDAQEPVIIDDLPVGEEVVPPFEGVACTMEAKICPDGSSVGRVGPNCEFAPCPSGSAE